MIVRRTTALPVLMVAILAGTLVTGSAAQATPPVTEAPVAIGPSWQISNTGSPNTLTTVDVVNPQVIWAVGGGFAANDGTVVRTLNGGQTWENVTPPDGTTQQFRDVEAFDANHAVVLASSTDNNEGPSRISRTDDGGAHWETVFDANPGDFYDSMGFFNRHDGLAFSDPVSGEFPILATHDSGGTWELVEPIAIPDALPDEFGRATGTSLVAVGPADAWFGTNPENDPGARVFHTQDGEQHGRPSRPQYRVGPAASFRCRSEIASTAWRSAAPRHRRPSSRLA